ncbi:hypothetical protein F5Y10DRAFT_96258 [Nemania abortiva]|nr:hypothetical protein F5Y10DRAFT_96258 [Nemania abortiva]
MSATAVVHCPKMGSTSGRPENGLPFGYNISNDTLLRPPSPRGDPILDRSDDLWLGNFFNGIESNHFNGISSNEGLMFSDQWIPPNLLGHATSYGRQPQADVAGTTMAGLPSTEGGDFFTFGQNTMPPPPSPSLARMPPGPSPIQQSRSQSESTLYHFPQQFSHPMHDQRSFQVPIEQDPHADAAALLTTLQSGHPNGHPNTYLSRMNSISSFPPSHHVQAPGNHRRSLSQAHPAYGHGDPVRPITNGADTLFTQMMFGSQESAIQQPAERSELQWGSDVHFNKDQCFVPPQHESSEFLEKKRVVAVGAGLKINSSTPNTRASSPIGNREVATYTTPEISNRNIKLEENGATPPRKRRKSKAKMEGEEDAESLVQPPSRATAKKRKSKGDLNGSSESPSVMPEASGKRRKSAPSQPKQPRENLTEAQKRENHIKSEQKRRGAIKEGFEDLTFIVPNLQNGGYSRSNILAMSGDWLEALVKGNEMLDTEGKYGPYNLPARQ